MPIVTLAGAGWFALDILERLSSRDWPSISGTVTGYRASRGCCVKRSMYFVQPIYAYAVDGNAYTSNRIANAIGGCANTEAGARESLEVNYPLKPSRTVYSDPNHPAAMRHRRNSTEPQSQFDAANRSARV